MTRRPLHIFLAAFALVALLGTQAMAAAVQITVNDRPITDVQISERAQLMRVEGRGSGSSERRRMAETELIDEAIMLGEADRLGITVSDSDIDSAFLSVARNSNLTSTRLKQLLGEAGVNVATLRERLRAGVAWSKVTQTEITPRVQISDLDVTQRAEQQVEESLSYDYLLKEIVFIVPQGSNVSISRRRAEAEPVPAELSGLRQRRRAVPVLYRRCRARCGTSPRHAVARGHRQGTGGDERRRHHQAACGRQWRFDAGDLLEGGSRDLTFIKNEIRTGSRHRDAAGRVDQYLKQLRDAAIIVRQ